MRIAVNPPPDLNLEELIAGARRAVHEAMQGGVNIIANDAKERVARGPKTGRIYTHHFRTGPDGGVFPVEKRSTPHQASAPGEAPATDTGTLVNSISGDVVVEGDRFQGYVRANTEYAAYLEHGTRKMAARPFLIPAIEANRQRVNDLIRIALATAAGVFARKRRR